VHSPCPDHDIPHGRDTSLFGATSIDRVGNDASRSPGIVKNGSIVVRPGRAYEIGRASTLPPPFVGSEGVAAALSFDLDAVLSEF
jgi:hypothetical protein